ncbi:DUF1062 domain-containing protein [Streptomyces sp. NPDC101175]|uniref:DUF1062 domain-containing protein n=1 Tax=Streptomyces sp. NPDC101175 TaxID=3366123 RepID=UPI003832FB72
MLENWVVTPTCLPLVRRRCHACGAGRFRASGKFRVNAHHKLLDVWLLVLCAGCGDTAKLTVMERANVRSVHPGILDRLHANDPVLTAELIGAPAVLRRNRVTLDWSGAWRLDTGGPDRPADEAIDVTVHFTARIPVRPVRLIAEGFALPRSEVETLITSGNLVSTARLNTRRSEDFGFTLKR